MLQIEGLVGAKEVLKTVSEKSSFLQSLHAKDCLRLLGMVCIPLGYIPAWDVAKLYASAYIFPMLSTANVHIG